jgi:hypothetical protein
MGERDNPTAARIFGRIEVAQLLGLTEVEVKGIV